MRSQADRILNGLTLTGSKMISLLSGLLAAFLILYSGYTLYENIYTQNLAFSSSWDLLDLKPEILDDGGTPLQGTNKMAALNEDYRAWITIYDTHIDYPVMQGSNDLYYASHDVNKKSSLTGAIYLSSTNSADFSDNYNVIFGHHMDNSAMFGGLDNYSDESYLSGHKEGVLISSKTVYDMNIFAALQTDAYESMVYNSGNRDINELKSFLEGNALYADLSQVTEESKIAALSTCSGAETNGRFVVFAILTDRNPDLVGTPDDPSEPLGTIDGPDDIRTEGETPEQPQPETPVQTQPGTPAEETPQTMESDNEPEYIFADEPEDIPDTTVDDEIIEEIEEIEEEDAPLAKFVNSFQPTGGSHGFNAWALVNLICLIITVYLFLPILHLKAKFGRKKYIEEENKARKFVLKFRIGVLLEALIAIVTIVTFLLTEDLSLPMTLTDRWTPFMLLLLAVCWVVDVILIRYRKKAEDNEEEAAAA